MIFYPVQRAVFIVVLAFFSFSCLGQSFQKKKFGIDEGLVSHLVKTTALDSIGFLWIGTDEGLVRYDGRTFTSFLNATPSRYIKKILSIEEELLVISDLGITKIIPKADSADFEQVLGGSRTQTDSTLWYPKDLFIDDKARLWVSEPGSIARVIDGAIKRYMFSEEELSNSFFRSFTLFNFQGGLYAFSYRGKLFGYDEQTDAFNPVDYVSDIPMQEVNQSMPVDSAILIGDFNGLHALTIKDGAPQIEFIDDFGLESISVLKKYGNDQLLIGDYGSQLLMLRSADMQIIKREEVFRSNSATLTQEGNIWVGSDEGLILLKNNFFDKISDETPYVESILCSGDSVYYCSQDALVWLKKSNGSLETKVIGASDDDYFLSLTGTGSNFWVSNRDKLQNYQNHRLVKEYDLSDRGLFIFSFLVDDDDNLWVTQDNVSGLLRIDKNGNFKEYQGTLGLSDRILCVKRIDGTLFAGGYGDSNFIYKYDEGEDEFVNLSALLKIEDFNNTLEINDITGSLDTAWLASSAGLLRYTDKGITRVDIGNYTELPVKAVALDGHYLWLANTFGVMRIDLNKKDSYLVFNENAGLSSRSGNARALLVDEDGTKWVGTARGISYSIVENEQFFETSRPLLTSFEVNAEKYQIAGVDRKVPNNSFVEFEFLSLNFPGESLEYQVLSSADGEAWADLGTNNFVQLPNLDQGSYEYLIRARQRSNFTWSKPLVVKFEVDYPYYRKWWFLILMALFVTLLVYVVDSVNSRRVKKASDKLNTVVKERTQLLLAANKELKQTNRELDMFVYSASHDLKAPLSSLKGLMNIYSKETDEQAKTELVEMMRSSVSKLDNFISEVIDYSKNSRTDLAFEEIDFDLVISDILSSYQYMENTDQIDIKLDIGEGPYFSDKNRVRIILNNLMSNAIRYSDLEKQKSYLKISISQFDGIIQFVLSDNGIGIDKEHQPKVFDMFYRANDNSIGSGLGLYIVKEALETLNGSIELSSELDKGSTFIIQFPNQRK